MLDVDVLVVDLVSLVKRVEVGRGEVLVLSGEIPGREDTSGEILRKRVDETQSAVEKGRKTFRD